MSEIRTDTINNASGDNDSGIDLSTNDQVKIKTANTTAVTVDASQNVGIGTSSPTVLDAGATGLHLHGDTRAQFHLTSSTTGTAGTDGMYVSYDGASGFLSMRENQPIIFQTNATERFKIESGGRFISKNSQTDATHQLWNTNASPYGLFIYFSTADPDNNSNYFLNCNANGADRLFIYSDGDIYNHDGTFAQISDRRIKDNITDANSQWDDIKAMRFVNYQRKDDIRQYGESEAKVQLGLIGQELEAVSPNLVRSVDPSAGDIISSSEFGSLYVEGDDIPEGKQVGDVKEVTDQVKGVAYSILYMKAVKALQEAMERIETLETAKTNLEARITALENA